MNAIDFLLQEHATVRSTFAQINDESRFDTKVEMFNALREDLVRHETMEQKVWYPHFKQSDKLEQNVKHLLKEEKDAAKALEEFDVKMSKPEWEKKFHKLKKDVERHANEEESKLFPNVKKILSEAELEKIGKAMQEFKDNFLKKNS